MYHTIISIILIYKILLYYLSATCTLPSNGSSGEANPEPEWADTGKFGNSSGLAILNGGLALECLGRPTSCQPLSGTFLGNLKDLYT